MKLKPAIDVHSAKHFLPALRGIGLKNVVSSLAAGTGLRGILIDNMLHQPFAIFALVILLCGSQVIAGDEADSDQIQATCRDSVERGRDFLVKLVDAEVNLLPEFRGHHVYWLYHDNYLVTKVLEKSNPALATAIRQAIEKRGENQSGKIEILFGEAKRPLPFRHYDLVEVARDNRRVIRTEHVTDREMKGWEAYADLRLLAAVALAKGDKENAVRNFEAALKMWNSKHAGFADAVVNDRKIYATYKLALAVIAADRLGKMDRLPEGLVKQLLDMQNKNGGWITDYHADGQPTGKANVETTCLAILAVDCFAASSK